MESYSEEEEEHVIKARKPYTITKQRERWTEEEHNRFLEAVKLHGRAWQRIEEHIGTKTAVQIRSHAQKFFTKLEKEALNKGVPVKQALNIDIPPPRPKRKPSNPYPRKTSAGSSSSQLTAKDGKSVTSLSSSHYVKDVLDLEKEPTPEKSSGDEKLGNVSKDQYEGNCRPFSFLQDASFASLSLGNNIPTSSPAVAINPCTFREFVPVSGEVSNQNQTNESCITIEPRINQKMDEHDKEQAFHDKRTSNTSEFGNSRPLHGHLTQDHNPDKPTQPGNFCAFPIKDIQGAQNYPRHVPVHIVDGSLGSSQNITSEISYHEQEHHQLEKGVEHQPTFSTANYHGNASRSSTGQIFPTFHPLMTPVHGNQDDNRSLHNISSTFSNFIVSALLQNPAAHAAASFAATFWPCANMEASSIDSVTGDIPHGKLNSSAPSIAAIAAATVAAATAWWAAHGLLPTCPPFGQGFTFPPPSAFASAMENSQPRATNIGEENTANPEGFFQETDVDANTKVPLQQQSASKSPALASLEDSEGGRERKLDTGSGAVDVEPTHLDSSNAKTGKQVDRSSCGSNTASSSDIETDALEKNEKVNEELKEVDASPSSDSGSRRCRSYISLNDSWKEVSQEGKLAFRALFSREVLPQSFSPPKGGTPQEVQQKINMGDREHENLFQRNENIAYEGFYLGNKQLWPTCSTQQQQQQQQEKSEISSLTGEQNVNGEKEKMMLFSSSIGGGGVSDVNNNKQKVVHRTGFKPYKRCSIEAKENRMGCTTRGVVQIDEKGPKRMRLGIGRETSS